MYKTIDLSILQKALEAGVNDTVHYTSFTNVVNEYVFREEHNWFVDYVVLYCAVSLADGNVVRVARVHVKTNMQISAYLYVIAMTNAKALNSWELLGATVLLGGAIRAPDYETEMNWFWKPHYRWNP